MQQILLSYVKIKFDNENVTLLRANWPSDKRCPLSAQQSFNREKRFQAGSFTSKVCSSQHH